METHNRGFIKGCIWNASQRGQMKPVSLLAPKPYMTGTETELSHLVPTDANWMCVL